MKKTLFNFRLLFMFLFACTLGYFAIDFLIGTEKDIHSFIGFSVFTLATLFVIVISPIAITFSDDLLIIHYFFGIKEEIKWTYIRKIEKIIVDKRPSHWHFWCYHIYLRQKQDKKAFFAVSEIPANRRIKKLLYRYYKPDFDKM